jgi:hypothetical protein
VRATGRHAAPVGRTRRRLHAVKRLLDAIYPELRALDAAEQSRALRRARDAPFDTLELIGMAAALVAVTTLTRYGLPLDAGERFAAVLLNFLIALPLLALLFAPFLVRKTRRALRAEREKRASG